MGEQVLAQPLRALVDTPLFDVCHSNDPLARPLEPACPVCAGEGFVTASEDCPGPRQLSSREKVVGCIRLRCEQVGYVPPLIEQILVAHQARVLNRVPTSFQVSDRERFSRPTALLPSHTIKTLIVRHNASEL
jgi:hypothetical protein